MFLREILVRAKFASTASEARRAIQNRGIRINGNLVEDVSASLFFDELEIDGSVMSCIILIENLGPESCDLTPFPADATVVSFGKKRHCRIFPLRKLREGFRTSEMQ